MSTLDFHSQVFPFIPSLEINQQQTILHGPRNIDKKPSFPLCEMSDTDKEHKVEGHKPTVTSQQVKQNVLYKISSSKIFFCY